MTADDTANAHSYLYDPGVWFAWGLHLHIDKRISKAPPDPFCWSKVSSDSPGLHGFFDFPSSRGSKTSDAKGNDQKLMIKRNQEAKMSDSIVCWAHDGIQATFNEMTLVLSWFPLLKQLIQTMIQKNKIRKLMGLMNFPASLITQL